MRRLSLEEKAGFGHPYGNAAFGRLLHRLRAVPLPFQGRHGLRAAFGGWPWRAAFAALWWMRLRRSYIVQWKMLLYRKSYSMWEEVSATPNRRRSAAAIT